MVLASGGGLGLDIRPDEAAAQAGHVGGAQTVKEHRDEDDDGLDHRLQVQVHTAEDQPGLHHLEQHGPKDRAERAPEPVAEVSREAETAETFEEEEREEPNFFETLETRQTARREETAPRYETRREEIVDEVPEPAYRPRTASIEAETDHAPEEFVAPRAPRAGTPSPEALARLQQAVNRAPRPVADTAAGEGERPRFGINSLINRMTGHGEERAATGQRAEAKPRVQPAVQAPKYSAEPRQQPVAREADPDQERIEIPAFLRRQAN